MLTDKFEARYQQLVQEWLTHDDLRRSSAPLSALADSGSRLGNARVAIARERHWLAAV